MTENEWDAVVVGGGAAGLSAAQMLGRARRRTLVIDAGAPRNRFAAHMHGVLGHDGLDPAELYARGRAEARAYGVEIVTGEVVAARDLGDRVEVTRRGGAVDIARALVLTSGLVDELPDIPGLAQRWGRDVLHCPYCHGFEVAGSRIGVLVTSPMGLHQAGLVRQWSEEVTAFTALAGAVPDEVTEALRARGVRIVASPVVRLEVAQDRLAGILTADGVRHDVDALFTAPTPRLELAYAASLALARADGPGSPLVVDATGATSHPRVWAAGNLVAPFGNVPVSMGSGSMAGAGANAGLVAQAAAQAVSARRRERNARWEERYAELDRVWSGRVNATTRDVVRGLPPGSALEIGCGEGADALWLAEQGWAVTAVDVSPTAIERAGAAARARGLGIDFRVADAAGAPPGAEPGALPDGPFDLVVSSFLHSWEVEFPRAGILRAGMSRVAPGGAFVSVSHAASPPWATEAHGDRPPLRTPREELPLLGVDEEGLRDREDGWTVELAEVRGRDVVDPDGAPAVIEDGVLVLRRHP
ncbi:FAD-dependent oxidoreductase [Microbacterium flavum]|uniref:FAD-dependent oxidoreductase n=1 Tax=Microbacterium flavum TaxID=415216 RepID=UPI0024ADC56C|nr:FAD-dependent oxidoreductase [Microbacterium flavum]